MFCVICLGLQLVTGALAFLIIEDPKIGAPITAAFYLYLAWFAFQSWGDAEVHSADMAARILHEAQAGRTPDLPDKLKGVFWMSTNAAPELLCTLEGSEFDPESCTVTFNSGAPLNWSYSGSTAGWIYWAGLRLSYLLCSKLKFRFDPEYSAADMPLYMCGCIWIPMGMVWTMEQIDENTWDRDIYLFCKPMKKWKKGSYILKRVIDGDGNELPAFQEMMASIEARTKIKGVSKKPLAQIINGWPGGGHCCGLLPGPDAWRVYDHDHGSSSCISSEESGADSSSSW